MVVWRHHHRLSDRVLKRYSLVLVSVLRSHSLVLVRVLRSNSLVLVRVLNWHSLVLVRVLLRRSITLVQLSGGIVARSVARSVVLLRGGCNRNVKYGGDVVSVGVGVGVDDFGDNGSINVDYVYFVLFKAAPLATFTYAD